MTMYFSKEHEWIEVDGNIATVGITRYAQEALGDLVYVELPEIGREADKDEDVAVVESVKIASEIYTPVAGKITEANDVLDGDPEALKTDDLSDGWIFKIEMSNPSELEELMSSDEYDSFVASLD